MIDTMQLEMKVAGKAFLIQQKRLGQVIESSKHDYLLKNRDLEGKVCELTMEMDKVECKVQEKDVQCDQNFKTIGEMAISQQLTESEIKQLRFKHDSLIKINETLKKDLNNYT